MLLLESILYCDAIFEGRGHVLIPQEVIDCHHLDGIVAERICILGRAAESYIQPTMLPYPQKVHANAEAIITQARSRSRVESSKNCYGI